MPIDKSSKYKVWVAGNMTVGLFLLVRQMINFCGAICARRPWLSSPGKQLAANWSDGNMHDFTLSMVRNRGNVPANEMEAFFAAGYGQQQVLEVILGLSQKVISNYVNHVAKTPVDKVFEQFAWQG